MKEHGWSENNTEGTKKKKTHDTRTNYFDPAVNFASLTLIDIAKEVRSIRKPPIFHHLKTSTSIIGLAANAHVKIDDPATIKGEHCVVMFRNGRYRIYPREGTVFADGSRVTHDGAVLENGSQIKLGSATLLFFATNLNNHKVVTPEPVCSPTPEPVAKKTPPLKSPEELIPNEDQTIRKREEILKQVYSEWTTDKLHLELKTERNNYEDIAITLMEEELKRRQVRSPIECPRCGVINSGSTELCHCGFYLTPSDTEVLANEVPAGRVPRDDDETILQPPHNLLNVDGPDAILDDSAGFFREERQDTKPCPMCGRPIKEQAIKCRHCGSYLDDDILRHPPAKKINPNLYTFSIWPGLALYILGLAFFDSTDTEGIGILFFILSMGVMGFAAVYHLICLHRCWSVLQGLTARTTPGKAVGFIFIPFYNFYWIFVAIHGLTLDTNEYLRRRNMPKLEINEGLSLATSIISVIPLVNFISPIFFNILIYQWARFHNRLIARSGMGNDAERPTTGFY